MLKEKEGMVPALILTLICVITTLLLAFTNNLTKDKIAVAEEKAAMDQMKALLPQAEEFTPMAEDKKTQLLDFANVKPEDVLAFNEAKASGQTVGYVLTVQTKGYGGQVPIMVGIDSNTNTINGVAILTNEETPGLGKKVENKAFTDQFKGKAADKAFTLKEAKGSQQKLDAVTGATISSNSVLNSLNKIVKIFKEIAQ